MSSATGAWPTPQDISAASIKSRAKVISRRIEEYARALHSNDNRIMNHKRIFDILVASRDLFSIIAQTNTENINECFPAESRGDLTDKQFDELEQAIVASNLPDPSRLTLTRPLIPDTDAIPDACITPYLSFKPTSRDKNAPFQANFENEQLLSTLLKVLPIDAAQGLSNSDSGRFVVPFASTDSFQALLARYDQWSTSLPGIWVYIPSHPVVIRDVLKSTIDLSSWKKAGARLLEANDNLVEPDHIQEIKGLEAKKGQRRDIVIAFSRAENAESAIRHGLVWHGERHRVSFHQLPVIPCSNCFSFTHIEPLCLDPPKCSRCAESHSVEECSSVEPKCAICGLKHSAFDDTCHARKEAETVLARRRAKSPKRYMSAKQFDQLMRQNEPLEDTTKVPTLARANRPRGAKARSSGVRRKQSSKEKRERKREALNRRRLLATLIDGAPSAHARVSRKSVRKSRRNRATIPSTHADGVIVKRETV